MNAFILVAAVFLLGMGLVLGLYFLVTKVPGMLLQRKLSSRLTEVTSRAG